MGEGKTYLECHLDVFVNGLAVHFGKMIAVRGQDAQLCAIFLFFKSEKRKLSWWRHQMETFSA